MLELLQNIHGNDHNCGKIQWPEAKGLFFVESVHFLHDEHSIMNKKIGMNISMH